MPCFDESFGRWFGPTVNKQYTEQDQNVGITEVLSSYTGMMSALRKFALASDNCFYIIHYALISKENTTRKYYLC